MQYYCKRRIDQVSVSYRRGDGYYDYGDGYSDGYGLSFSPAMLVTGVKLEGVVLNAISL